MFVYILIMYAGLARLKFKINKWLTNRLYSIINNKQKYWNWKLKLQIYRQSYL